MLLRFFILPKEDPLSVLLKNNMSLQRELISHALSKGRSLHVKYTLLPVASKSKPSGVHISSCTILFTLPKLLPLFVLLTNSKSPVSGHWPWSSPVPIQATYTLFPVAAIRKLPGNIVSSLISERIFTSPKLAPSFVLLLKNTWFPSCCETNSTHATYTLFPTAAICGVRELSSSLLRFIVLLKWAPLSP